MADMKNKAERRIIPINGNSATKLMKSPLIKLQNFVCSVRRVSLAVVRDLYDVKMLHSVEA